MGEAARRKATETAWLTSLNEQERTLVRTAKSLGKALPLDGACYRASMFLRLFLAKEHGIEGNAVVGYVNDGTDELYSSHAWFEFRGQRTDLTLCRPMNPEVQKRGRLVIHGRVITEGWSSYTYHLQQPPAGLAIVRQLMSNPSLQPMVAEQEELHLRMLTTAKDDALIRIYLDDAPDGLTYDRIAGAVRRGSR
jgi:hypothetical protein